MANIADKEITSRVGVTTKQWMLLIISNLIFTNHLLTINEAAKAYGALRQNLKRIAFFGKHKPYFEGKENQK